MYVRASFLAVLAMLYAVSANGQIDKMIGGGGLGLSGALTITDKSHNPAYRAGVVITAVDPKSDRTIGYVGNGEAIASPWVDLEFTLTLDNVEVRDEKGRYVQLEIIPDRKLQDNRPRLIEMEPAMTGDDKAIKTKQFRVFRAFLRAGELPYGGYTFALQIRAAKRSSIRFLIVGVGSRGGEAIQTSFHMFIDEPPQPADEKGMASQLRGFNIPPSLLPPQDVRTDPIVRQFPPDVREENTVPPTPKVEELASQEWVVATTIKATVYDQVSRKDTGKPYPCDMRFVFQVVQDEPNRSSRPSFAPSEKASSGYTDGKILDGEATVDVKIRATGDVYIVAWIEGQDGSGKPAWSKAIWVKVDPDTASASLKFPMIVPTKGRR